jgi:hypothetical protein
MAPDLNKSSSEVSAKSLASGQAKTYKSPQRKLVRFFEKSRNQWKSKFRDAKVVIKRLQNRIRFLEKSKARDQHRIRELESTLKDMKTQVRVIEKEFSDFKEKYLTEKTDSGKSLTVFRQPLSYHMYSVGHVMLFVSLVLSAATSLRGASQVMTLVMSMFGLPFATPSWFTGRMWLLRLGYYKLTRPKEPGDDWVWIADHTVQLGPEKCFVIVGLRLSALPASGRPLTHEDVEPLALFPVTSSTGEVVYQQLKETITKTGMPRQIVADQGSDLRCGIETFCQRHPETCYVYDIKHKTATVLKHDLQGDDHWQAFTRLATQTKHQVQQTALAFLAPPNQRTKARYMNLESLVDWGCHLLRYVDEQRWTEQPELDAQVVQAKLGWIEDFRQPLEEWGELLKVVEVSESWVRHRGLYRGVHRDLKQRLAPVARTSRAKRVSAHLVAFVAAESLKAYPDERLIGSSEVLESIFGKLKRLEQDQAKTGFTGLVLSVAAMVSTTTTEVIQNALESVRTKKVIEWCKKTLGQSVPAKRKEAFASRQKTEQKKDQFKVAV